MQKISENQLIVKSNKLIEASYNLNFQETRVIVILASLIKKDDEHFRRVILKVKDFVDFLGVKDGKAYKRLQKITDSLGDKSIIIKETDPVTNKTQRKKIQWLSASIYHEGDGIVELEFSDLLKPFLLKLKSDFTKYQLKYVLRLSSSYHIRLYECARQWVDLRNGISLSIEELRERLGLPDHKYKLYADLKKRVLLPGQEKIKKETDVVLHMKEVKEGRKIKKIFFKAERQINIIENDIPLPPPEEVVTDAALLDLLTNNYAVSYKEALGFIKKYPESQIKENLEYVNHRISMGKVDTVGPYTAKAIKDNYKLQLSLFDIKKQEKEENLKKEAFKNEIEAELKAAYQQYWFEEIDKFQNNLSVEELKQISETFQDQVEKEKGKSAKGIKLFVQMEIEKHIAAQAGILDIEKWKESKRRNN